MDAFLLSQYVLSGLVIGVIYGLMALGITFIYSIMKMINWSMGEFYMIGSYVQYALLAGVLGWSLWYVALPVAMVSVFLLGLLVQRFLLRPMYVGGVERRDEYATIVTIALMVLFRNLAVVLGGPNQYAPRDYARPITLLTLPISGVIAYRYWVGAGRLRSRLRFGVLALTREHAARRLTTERQALIAELERAKNDYLTATKGSSF